MTWLDGLSAALTAGTQGAAGWLEGQRKGRLEQEARAKELMEQLRQKRRDEQQALYEKAQIDRWLRADKREAEQDERQGQLDVMNATNAGWRAQQAPLQTGSPIDQPFIDIANEQAKGGVTLGGRKMLAPIETATQRAQRERQEDLRRREIERAEDRTQRLKEIAASRAEPSWSYAGMRDGKEVWVNTKNPEQSKLVDANRSATAGGRGAATTSRLIASNNKQLAAIDLALDEVRRRPQSFGIEFGLGLFPGLGSLADPINQRNDPDGVEGRSIVSNVSSLEIKDRSGAAVTIHEFPRLAPFVPMAYDTPEKITKNLNQLKYLILKHNQALARGDYNSPDVLERGSGMGLPASVTSPTGPTNDQYADIYQKYNLTRP